LPAVRHRVSSVTKKEAVMAAPHRALQDGVSYGSIDWQAFNNGQAVDGCTFLMNGPEPQLSMGTLPNGRTASGGLVYEVPAPGELRLSYENPWLFGNSGPVFEVLLRGA
jgi:hypothetical protein